MENRTAPNESEAQNLAIAWEYALDDIPEKHFEELSRRSIHNKRDTYPLSAIDMRREWDTLQADLIALEQEARDQRLQALVEDDICIYCLGAGWLRKPASLLYQLPPRLVKCPHCEGPAPQKPKTFMGKPMYWSEWKAKHKIEYPAGCDKEHCIVCYAPLSHAGNLIDGLGWTHGAPIPTKEEDEEIRRRIAAK